MELIYQEEKESLVADLRQYDAYAKNLENDSLSSHDTVPKDELLSSLMETEAAMLQELEAIEAECSKCDLQILEAQNELSSTQNSFATMELKLCQKEVERFFTEENENASSACLANTKKEIKFLSDLCLLPSLFSITTSSVSFVTGSFSSDDRRTMPLINGMRLSFKSQSDLDFVEFNAAWATATLCLAVTSKACKASFQKYIPAVDSSFFPYLLDVRTKNYLFLSLPDFQPENVSKFDKALSAFVSCVHELAKAALIVPSLPCAIDGETVMGMSVRLYGNALDKWTQALVYLFRNVRRVVEHISNVSLALVV